MKKLISIFALFVSSFGFAAGKTNEFPNSKISCTARVYDMNDPEGGGKSDSKKFEPRSFENEFVAYKWKNFVAAVYVYNRRETASYGQVFVQLYQVLDKNDIGSTEFENKVNKTLGGDEFWDEKSGIMKSLKLLGGSTFFLDKSRPKFFAGVLSQGTDPSGELNPDLVLGSDLSCSISME